MNSNTKNWLTRNMMRFFFKQSKMTDLHSENRSANIFISILKKWIIGIYIATLKF